MALHNSPALEALQHLIHCGLDIIQSDPRSVFSVLSPLPVLPFSLFLSRSLTDSQTPTASSRVVAAENQPPEADRESDDKMNSGYSSLSTKLSMKNPSCPKEEEPKLRFHKVSLISEADTASEASQDAVDATTTTVTELNGADLSSEYRWKNRFEGVSQYKPYRTENSSVSDSPSYRMSDLYTPNTYLSSSALPEAAAHKYLGYGYAFSSSPPTSSQEPITFGDRLNDRTRVYLSHGGESAVEQKGEWRSRSAEQEEPAAPAGESEQQRDGESERIKSVWDSQQLPESGLSSAQQPSSDSTDSFKEDADDSSRFTGVFQATLVELVSDPAAPPSTPPASPETESPCQFEMDSLVDTLKSMGPSLRPRNMGLRAAAPGLVSSLPPIVEDAPSPVTTDTPASLTSPVKKMEASGNRAESLNGLYTLPVDLGLKRSTTRDTRSPLELMKQNQQVSCIQIQSQ